MEYSTKKTSPKLILYANFNNIQIFFHSLQIQILIVSLPLFSYTISNIVIMYTRLMTCDVEDLLLVKKKNYTFNFERLIATF